MRLKITATLLFLITLVQTSFGNDNLKDGFTIGTPVLKSIQAIAFGPENILFIGDNTGSMVYAIEINDRKNTSKINFNINNITAKIGAVMGASAIEIKILDMAVNPVSKNVFFAVSRENRGTTKSALFVLSDKGLQEFSLTNVNFSKNKIDNENQSINQVIIPRKAAQELLRLMDKFEGAVEIKIAKNSIKFSLGDVELNAKLIDGRFPDFNNVVPEQSKHSFNINKLSFKSALSRVSILSNEKYKGIRLDLSNQLMTINANNPEQDEAEEEVVVDYNGDEMSMGFNSSYLMDALNVIESDNVLVSFTDTNSSCLLENPEDKSSQFIIMPMRI